MGPPILGSTYPNHGTNPAPPVSMVFVLITELFSLGSLERVGKVVHSVSIFRGVLSLYLRLFFNSG